MPQTPAMDAWQKKNTVQVALRLNRRTDADILAAIDGATSAAGAIKKLVREGLAAREAAEKAHK